MLKKSLTFALKSFWRLCLRMEYKEQKQEGNQLGDNCCSPSEQCWWLGSEWLNEGGEKGSDSGSISKAKPAGSLVNQMYSVRGGRSQG